MKRGLAGLSLMAAVLVLVTLPSVYRAKQNTLRSLAQDYFRRVERGDWPARSGPCPPSPRSSAVQSCLLNDSNRLKPEVQFTLRNGERLTLTAEAVRP